MNSYGSDNKIRHGPEYLVPSDIWFSSILPGTPVVPFSLFYLGASFLKLTSRIKGTRIIKGFVGNLD